MRLFLVNPKVNFLGFYDFNMENASNAALMKGDIEKALSILKSLKHYDSLQCKLYDGVPMYSAVWLKSENKNAIFVEFYTYGGSPATRPSLEIRVYSFSERKRRSSVE